MANDDEATLRAQIQTRCEELAQELVDLAMRNPMAEASGIQIVAVLTDREGAHVGVGGNVPRARRLELLDLARTKVAGGELDS